jgi:hypothetical protein
VKNGGWGYQEMKDSTLRRNTDVLRKKTELGHSDKSLIRRIFWRLFWNETTNTNLAQTPCPHIHNLGTRCTAVANFMLRSLNTHMTEPGIPLPFKLPTKHFCTFLIPPTRAICRAHLVQLDCIILPHVFLFATSSTTALSHRKPGSTGTSRDSDKRTHYICWTL